MVEIHGEFLLTYVPYHPFPIVNITGSSPGNYYDSPAYHRIIQ